jgi:NADP-dependent 3-hydroxy acid dehydrogenase YdfG
VIASRTEKDLDRIADHVKKISPKTQVLKVVTDVTDKSSEKNLFKEALNRFKEIDVPRSSMLSKILVNNAGMLEKGSVVGESDIDTWCQVWDVNIKVGLLSID